jgi:hypothetical protein
MPSKNKNIRFIEKHFDTYSNFILKKLERENITLANKETSFVSNICYSISNYIDFVNNKSTVGLEDISIDNIKKLYMEWIDSEKKTFTTKNYIEKNEIIIDYRVNNVGFYWVDLNSYYSSEMLFRLNNCARANSYQNILELREHTIDDYNFSLVAVVIHKDGHINQIRGKNNQKVDLKLKYRDYIYDLFLNYKVITGFKFHSSKELDFSYMDLKIEQLNILRSVRPEIFKLI